MARTPITESYHDYPGDGVTPTFAITFDYDNATDVFVSVDGVDVSFTFDDESTVRPDVVPAASTTVRVYRNVDVDNVPSVFATGTPFIKRFVDNNFKLVIFAVQEVADRIAEVITSALRVPFGETVNELPDAATRANRALGFDAAGEPALYDAFSGEYVDFDPQSPAPGYLEGRTFYDLDERALTYYNDESDVSVNLGQELVIRVRNQSGAAVSNGDVVQIQGATGQVPTIELADATLNSGARILGVVTQTTIANNGFGYVTIFGKVRDVDTSAWVAGDILYLDPAVPGGLTTTAPVYPNYVSGVALVIYSHAVNGVLGVRPQALEQLHTPGRVVFSDVGGRHGDAPTFTYDSGTGVLDVPGGYTVSGIPVGGGGGGGSSISNGTTSVTIPAVDGDILVNIDGVTPITVDDNSHALLLDTDWWTAFAMRYPGLSHGGIGANIGGRDYWWDDQFMVMGKLQPTTGGFALDTFSQDTVGTFHRGFVAVANTATPLTNFASPIGWGAALLDGVGGFGPLPNNAVCFNWSNNASELMQLLGGGDLHILGDVIANGVTLTGGASNSISNGTTDLGIPTVDGRLVLTHNYANFVGFESVHTSALNDWGAAYTNDDTVWTVGSSSVAGGMSITGWSAADAVPAFTVSANAQTATTAAGGPNNAPIKLITRQADKAGGAGNYTPTVAIGDDEQAVLVDTGSNLTALRGDGYFARNGKPLFQRGSTTLTLEGTTTPGSHTYTNQTALWWRQEDLVTVKFCVTCTVDAAIAGNIYLEGLPFNAVVSSGITGYAIVALPLGITVTGRLGIRPGVSTRIQLGDVTSSAWTQITETALGGTINIEGELTYVTNAA